MRKWTVGLSELVFEKSFKITARILLIISRLNYFRLRSSERFKTDSCFLSTNIVQHSMYNTVYSSAISACSFEWSWISRRIRSHSHYITCTLPFLSSRLLSSPLSFRLIAIAFSSVSQELLGALSFISPLNREDRAQHSTAESLFCFLQWILSSSFLFLFLFLTFCNFHSQVSLLNTKSLTQIFL